MLVEHQLIDSYSKIYCQLCQQSWKSRPRKKCPGVKVEKKSDYLLRCYAPEDARKRENLRLIEPVCCYKQGKEYVYLYELDSRTEPYYPDLPPILPESDSLWRQKMFSRPEFEEVLALKNETGLKSLNLAPHPNPNYCYWDWKQQDFAMLYNPLDCRVLDPNLPPVYDRESIEARSPQLLALNRLASFNLKPGEIPPKATYWNRFSKRWIYFYDREDCQVLDPDLPPVFLSWEEMRRQFPEAIYSETLASLNLKPKPNASAVVFWREYGRSSVFYLPEECETVNPDLPPVYHLFDIPSGYFYESELKIFNRSSAEAAPSGVVWSYYRKAFNPLYRFDDCAIADPSLPKVYARTKSLHSRYRSRLRPLDIPGGIELIPKELKANYIWTKINPLLELSASAEARGCYWDGNCLLSLFAITDFQVHNRECFLSKTQIKEIYHLPPSLLKELGAPDEYGEHPLNSSFPRVHLYSRYRVERFIAHSAQAYVSHLVRYKYSVGNLNEELEAWSRRALDDLEVKELRTRIGSKGKRAIEQFGWNYSEPKALQQAEKCLECASSECYPDFLCAINPFGFDLNSGFCPDYVPRS